MKLKITLYLIIMFGTTLLAQEISVPNTYIADHTADTDNGLSYTPGDGTNTLRKCIRLSNTHPGADAIHFAVTGTIFVNSDLPAITETVTIDGSTVPGFSSDPLITVNGSDNFALLTYTANTSGSVIKALAVARGKIDISFSNVENISITGCHIIHNNSSGILFTGVKNSRIGGSALSERNIISGNNFNGIYLSSSSSNIRIENNNIGTNITGSGSDNNVHCGVFIENSGSNIITGNLISANHGGGIRCSTAHNNIITNNRIGLSSSDAILGNSIAGILLENSNNNTIGGTGATERNVISGNNQNGISILNSNSNTIQNNYIGTNSSGNESRGNQGPGINLNASGSNKIIGNVISANIRAIYSNLSDDTEIKGNIIGLNASGTQALAPNNYDGIYIIQGNGVKIGGPDAADRNIISGNGAQGILLESCLNAEIEGNYIGTDIGGNIDLGNTSNGLYLT